MTTEVLIGGVDYGPHVVYEGAAFTARVNGAVGDCSFMVRDDGHAFNFTFGQEIQLKVDGTVRWGGWILRPQQVFALPVVPSPTVSPRMWQIEGVDYNAVFDKRVLHDDAHPNRQWSYDAGTWDDDVLNDVWDHFDMSGFTKDIHRVGTAVLDIKGVTGRDGGEVAAGGFTLRDVFTAVARNTAAIFFCTPEKVVTYLDSDSQTTSLTITDTPSGGDDVAYREAQIVEDATAMCNDALVWGAGYGSQSIVFARLASPSSIDAHGLWQVGQFTGGVYRQASVNAIASSMVNGSPDAHRGGKYAKRSVIVSTFDDRVSIGDVVAFHCSSFLLPTPTPSHDDVLPVREMLITFPAVSTKPKFKLTLTWEIDAAWSIFDPWVPPPISRIPPIGGGIGSPPSDPLSVCLADDFDRPDQIGWGTSSSGLDWASDDGLTLSAGRGVAYFESHDGGGSGSDGILSGAVIQLPADLTVIRVSPPHFLSGSGLDFANTTVILWIGSGPSGLSPVSINIYEAQDGTIGGLFFSLGGKNADGDSSGVESDIAGPISASYPLEILLSVDETGATATIGGSVLTAAWADGWNGPIVIDPTVYEVTLGVSPQGYEDPLITSGTVDFDHLMVVRRGAGCADVILGGIGVRVTDVLVCTSVPRFSGPDLIYDAGSVWKTSTASYAPGSEVVFVNGVAQWSGIEEYDPASGFVVLDFEVSVDDVVAMSYLTNGALP